MHIKMENVLLYFWVVVTKLSNMHVWTLVKNCLIPVAVDE